MKTRKIKVDEIEIKERLDKKFSVYFHKVDSIGWHVVGEVGFKTSREAQKWIDENIEVL